MLQIFESILARAEQTAESGGSLVDVLRVLREMPLEDFGLFLIDQPSSRFPALGKLLPAMASAEVQTNWTGAAGSVLYPQTASFARLLETNYLRQKHRPLLGTKIMDFGCGYGRISRMMYYFTDPENIWGIDAWERSLATCHDARMAGNFVLSELVPATLPVGDTKFDLIFSLSVFTHLPMHAITSVLGATRQCIADDGLLIATIRPVEIWRYLSNEHITKVAEKLIEDHVRDGYAYVPHFGPEGETYGDTSLEPRLLEQSGWNLAGLDRSVLDPYQIACVLRPV